MRIKAGGGGRRERGIVGGERVRERAGQTGKRGREERKGEK